MTHSADSADEGVHCDQCGIAVDRDDAIRRKTFGELDSKKWQTLCCPRCGRRIKTVFVGLEG